MKSPHPLRTFALLMFGVLSATLPAARAGAGTDGFYATTDDNDPIEVKFSPGNLEVGEPNKTVTSIDAQWELVSVEEPDPPATAPRRAPSTGCR